MAVNGHTALEGVSNLSLNGPPKTDYKTGTFKVKSGMAQMAKGGIVMDVVNAEQAKIAENAGACAVSFFLYNFSQSGRPIFHKKP